MRELCYLLLQLFRSTNWILCINRIPRVLQILVQRTEYHKIQSQNCFAYNFLVLKVSSNPNEQTQSYAICMTSCTGMQTNEEHKAKANNQTKCN